AIDYAKIEAALAEKQNELKSHIDARNNEVEDKWESQREEHKNAIDTISDECKKLGDKLHEIEQKGLGGGDVDHTKSIGEQFAEHESIEQFKSGAIPRAQMEYKAIINATPGTGNPLVPEMRVPGIIHEPNRVLRIRDVLSVGRTTSNTIYLAKENVYTNNAGPQIGGSPEQRENVTKPTSDITFTSSTVPVETLAHLFNVSKQVLDDSPMLAGYINNRGMYGLKLEEDDQLLNGSGANGNLSGIVTNQTSYAPQSPNNNQNNLDLLRDAMRQLQVGNYIPSAIILNPTDWANIELLKVNAGTDDRYIIGDPSSRLGPQLWGLPVVPTNTLAAGTFVVIDGAQMGMLWDRADATVAMSEHHDANFAKNMVTIRMEERLALAVERPSAIVGGSLI
ncbi:MAG: phage major capsid protein, partial [Rickettsiales bacterium]